VAAPSPGAYLCVFAAVPTVSQNHIDNVDSFFLCCICTSSNQYQLQGHSGVIEMQPCKVPGYPEIPWSAAALVKSQ
jgi:hypothetical protein